MGWTPPSKLIVILTFLLMAFGLFIFMDKLLPLWPDVLPTIQIDGYPVWMIIGMILFFLTWFLFFLGVKFKGI